MCKPTPVEVIDALLKKHKNAWKDALRFVVEQALKDHEKNEELLEKIHVLHEENQVLRERILKYEPTPKSWFEEVIEVAKSLPEPEPIFPPNPTGSTTFPGEPRMRYGGGVRPNVNPSDEGTPREG
jgi:hypothetical protein